MPHDPALTPSVDPSVSLIPPLNTSSSHYDGMTRPLSLAFPGVGSSKYFLPRLCLPPHGSEYSGTSEYSNYRHHLTPDVQFSRYMVLGYSFPGTAGLYTSSKSHSRISVDIRARRHIGIGLSVMRFFLLKFMILMAK